VTDIAALWAQAKDFIFGFDRANWISVSAAAVSVMSLCATLYNNHLANWRERRKNKREDFRTRVAPVIEKALESFDAVYDSALDLSAAASVSDKDLDSLETKAKAAQRSLSKALRRAAESKTCETKGWNNLGLSEYDEFMEALEEARAFPTTERGSALGSGLVN
jgi:hypothetical protein